MVRLATEHELRMVLGHRIREARRRVGLSQAELAECIGIHQPSVSCIENGRTPLRHNLDRIVEATRTPLYRLLEAPTEEELDRIAAHQPDGRGRPKKRDGGGGAAVAEKVRL